MFVVEYSLIRLVTLYVTSQKKIPEGSSPDFRKKYSGVSFADVLISLSGKVLQNVGYDASLGVAVKVAGVENIATNIGFKYLSKNKVRGNYECDLVAQYALDITDQLHPDPILNRYILNLWEKDNSVLTSIKN